MKITGLVNKIKFNKITTRLIKDKKYRITVKAVYSLIYNLLFSFYNGIIGISSPSIIFLASSFYYLLLSITRFFVVISRKKQYELLSKSIVGIMLIILSIIFHLIVLISIKNKTATLYGTITMITIATFTFTKITAAIITAIKHKNDSTNFFKTINAIRYSEVAVSLLTMQQSMLVSFGENDNKASTILNAFTGAAVCLFIFILGIFILRNSRKEN